ncbi:hypothetical protein [Burkholderia sp. D-99]|uniref:hypothetical protein n=1 Tax=Burkholderia sp. D-99 TaxID=2717316 RepID=UPI001AA1B50E|nr:hypothetical protein [Burkholderia sp. D-99]
MDRSSPVFFNRQLAAAIAVDAFRRPRCGPIETIVWLDGRCLAGFRNRCRQSIATQRRAGTYPLADDPRETLAVTPLIPQ